MTFCLIEVHKGENAVRTGKERIKRMEKEIEGYLGEPGANNMKQPLRSSGSKAKHKNC